LRVNRKTKITLDMFSWTHPFCHTHAGKGNYTITFTSNKYSGWRYRPEEAKAE